MVYFNFFLYQIFKINIKYYLNIAEQWHKIAGKNIWIFSDSKQFPSL